MVNTLSEFLFQRYCCLTLIIFWLLVVDWTLCNDDFNTPDPVFCGRMLHEICQLAASCELMDGFRYWIISMDYLREIPSFSHSCCSMTAPANFNSTWVSNFFLLHDLYRSVRQSIFFGSRFVFFLNVFGEMPHVVANTLNLTALSLPS